MSASSQPRRDPTATPPRSNARLEVEAEDPYELEVELRGYTRSVVGALEKPGRPRGSRRLGLRCIDVAAELTRTVESDWRRDPQAAALAAVRLAELHDARLAPLQAGVALRVFDTIIGGRVLPVGIGARDLADLRSRIEAQQPPADVDSPGVMLG